MLHDFSAGGKEGGNGKNIRGLALADVRCSKLHELSTKREEAGHKKEGRKLGLTNIHGCLDHRRVPWCRRDLEGCR
jgi:hypothetical protein